MAETEYKLQLANKENERLTSIVDEYGELDFTNVDKIKEEYEKMLSEVQELKKEQVKINQEAAKAKNEMLQALKKQFKI